MNVNPLDLDRDGLCYVFAEEIELADDLEEDTLKEHLALELQEATAFERDFSLEIFEAVISKKSESEAEVNGNFDPLDVHDNTAHDAAAAAAAKGREGRTLMAGPSSSTRTDPATLGNANHQSKDDERSVKKKNASKVGMRYKCKKCGKLKAEHKGSNCGIENWARTQTEEVWLHGDSSLTDNRNQITMLKPCYPGERSMVADPGRYEQAVSDEDHARQSREEEAWFGGIVKLTEKQTSTSDNPLKTADATSKMDHQEPRRNVDVSSELGSDSEIEVSAGFWRPSEGIEARGSGKKAGGKVPPAENGLGKRCPKPRNRVAKRKRNPSV